MTFEDWVRTNLTVIPDGWGRMDSTTEDAVRFVGGEGQVVTAPLVWLCEKFGPEAPAFAASIKAKDPENTLGWYKHFDAWVAQGILPVE